MKKNISGMTLVELLVGITLSLIILGATITIYLSTKQTNVVNEGSINIQNDAQLALLVLKNDIQKTGWVNDSNTEIFGLDNSITTASSDGGGTVADVIAVSFESCDSSIARNDCRTDGTDAADCNGVAVAGGARITNRYQIVNGSLVCNNVALIDNVDNFQVEYGFYNGVGVDYVPLSGVTDRSKIITVRFGLIISTENSLPDGRNQTLKLFDTDFDFTDKKLRRVFSATVPILNRQSTLLIGV
ncbi:PilW family protein [Kangiella sp. TOML190]|uniref:PilW family protein n=1 Tax=Kangiella sp. TOML190 TaxID=2931351 RepID=UPI00203E42B4|nr:PilW family protein [Kangiella sp. TOML190]